MSRRTPARKSATGGGSNRHAERDASRYTVAALDKGMRILSTFSERHQRLRVAEIAAHVGLPVPTTFRMLRTLYDAGYVEQLPDGSYRPGVSVLTLGFAALQTSDVVEAAREPLGQLAQRTKETVNLAVLIESDILYLHRIKNTDLITANLQVGSRLPAAATSIGKVLLAQRDQEELRKLITPEELARASGPNAIRSVEEFLEECAEIRRRGWAIQDEEFVSGLRSIAAPVRDPERVVAGVNIAVQASRWSRDALIDVLLAELLSTARLVSLRLGCADPGERLTAP